MPLRRSSLAAAVPLLWLFALGCGGDPAPRSGTDSGPSGGDSGGDLGTRDSGGPVDCLPQPGACYTRGAGGCCVPPGSAPSCGADRQWHCPAGMDLVDRCPPCADDWSSCSSPAQCTLVANDCCGVCGNPTLGNVDAVNTLQLDAHRAEVCPVPQPCLPCPTGTNPDLLATCAAGRCAAFDVRTLDASACNTDSDCHVRVTGCCECGGDTSPHALIAISSESAYSALLCDPGQGCPECEPIYPDGVTAVCEADGHCRTLVAEGGP